MDVLCAQTVQCSREGYSCWLGLLGTASIRTHWSAHQAPPLVFVAKHGISCSSSLIVGMLGRIGREARLVGVQDTVCPQAGIPDVGVVLQQEGPPVLKEVIHLLRGQHKTHLYQLTKSMAATNNQGWHNLPLGQYLPSVATLGPNLLWT